jgi:phosphoglycolate phosphatase
VSDLLVLWDVDYTLLSADGLGTRLYERAFQAMYGRELAAVAPKAGRTERAIITDTLALAGIPEPTDQVDRFLDALARQVAAVSPDVPVRPLAGAAAAIAALAGASVPRIRQSVLTGNMRPLAVLKLAAAGLDDHLDLDVGAYGEAHEVRAELVTVARLAARQAYGQDFGGLSTILVGDTPLDVAAALATGARAVGVATGSFTSEQLAAAGAHAVLPDLTDTALVIAAVAG